MLDDLSVYLADFGVTCLANGRAFLGILDQPDDTMQFEVGRAQSNVQMLTVMTSEVTTASLAAKTAITVGGVAYTVASIDQPDDAAFTTLRIRRG